MGGNAFPKFSGHIPVTDIYHRRVHQGLYFSINLFDAALANDGMIDLILRTTEEIHIRPFGALGGDATLALFEAPTLTADGTPETVINHNRITSIVSTTLAFSGPTVSVTGLELDTHLLPGGIGGVSQGGSAELVEWVLKPNEDYCFRLTNISGSIQPAHLQLDWYEPKRSPSV